jgi:hypothetical protein
MVALPTGPIDAGIRQMNRFQYPAIIALALWTPFAPAAADAQDMPRVRDASAAPLVLTQPQAATHTLQSRPGWMTSIRFPAGSNAAGVLRAQDPRGPRSERGLGRKVFGAIVGAAGGFFAGGYLGAAIEGDRCHCDDPGLKGALIGMPIGATAGGILGWHYLF